MVGPGEVPEGRRPAVNQYNYARALPNWSPV